jgi:hypothetical protein
MMAAALFPKKKRDLNMRALIGFSAALGLALAGEARAADWYTGVPTDGPVKPASPTVAIDVAIDGTSQKALSGALIGTIAPFGSLDQSGMRIRLAGLGGVYSYISGQAGLGRVRGTLEDGSFMAGYEWVMKKATVAVYGGADVMNSSLSPDDPYNPAKGLRAGFKMGVEAYVTPTDFTMISGVASYSTNNNSYYGRLKFGMALAERLYIGPEVVALGDNFFQQWRFGGHVSGIRFGILQMGASAGFLNDRVRGAGLYGILESRLTF